ncbi:MAG: hypothetical protein AAF502_12015 [Bacteroidota bacterium]
MKVTKIKTIVVALSLSLFAIQNVNAQFDVGADFVSRYLWRGLDFSTAPSIQPWVSYSFEKDNFGLEVGAWGSYSFNGNDGSEADLYLTISQGPVSLTITDYFFPTDMAMSHDYFEYSDTLTGHILEGMLMYEGPEKFPFTATFAYNFFGADAEKVDGDPASFYAELLYTPIEGLDVFVGGGNGFYSMEPDGKDDEFGITNIGLTYTKEFKISETFTLPAFGTLAFNPDAEKIYILFGLSF